MNKYTICGKKTAKKAEEMGMDTMIIAMFAVLCILMAADLILVLRKKDRSDMPTGIERRLDSLETSFGRFDPMIREEFVRNREESAKNARENREELSVQQEKMKQTIDGQLKNIREENEKRLEEMRKTVDENLKTTVEKRFDESFKLISERLEQVHRGLGEMKQLADGVYDLKKVLANVKTRGNLGEIQLGSILEQVLSPGQYEPQRSVKEGSLERVDYVIKLPDKNSMNETLLLPIDSKFPTEDYQRLISAYDSGLAENEMKSIENSFESSVKRAAKDIHDKYINPPKTTDFAIMFVPAEGLYAEIVRRADLFETIRNTYKVTVVGPTNLAAFLSSLQMGFRTLAIERRSNEVWELLGAVKTEFGKYGAVMDSIKKKIDSAAKEIDTVGVRSRAIERKLRSVEELPAEESTIMFGDGMGDEPEM
ncbi:MAG: DNA recombination protein RmuC [Candidatus Methanoplasma sp.]|nr:DNA recombination protein RmuC [Candidatus Methanoplasma sp.]